MKAYNFLKKLYNRKDINDGERTLSMTSALKPLTIGSINNISNANVNYLRNKIIIQLKRLSTYENKLSHQISDPKYIKVQQRNKIDLQFLKKSELIHKSYFNKILYYKSKTLNVNVGILESYHKLYSNQLFMLNQQYQKAKLQMKGINTNENIPGNNIQFSNI